MHNNEKLGIALERKFFISNVFGIILFLEIMYLSYDYEVVGKFILMK